MGCSNSKSVGEKTLKDLKNDVERTKKAVEKAEKKEKKVMKAYTQAQGRYRDSYYDDYKDRKLTPYRTRWWRAVSKLVEARWEHDAALKALAEATNKS